MTTASPAPTAGSIELEGFGAGYGPGWRGTLTYGIAIVFAAFHIYNAAFAGLPSIVSRSIHVGFLLLLAFLLLAHRRPRQGIGYFTDWALGILGFAVALYHWVEYKPLIVRSGDPTAMDIAVGVVAILLVFEAGRRVMGIALPLICALFLAYGLFGQHLPAPLDHHGYGFEQVIDHLFVSTEGIYGTPTLVFSTYIFLFILFSSFLERAGMIDFFNDLALGTVGHHRGGPAKVAVISSALMGTISGSGVANVVSSGQFTIPLMMRFGYRPAFAGAVEATSSMGGQIMPPVMGAVAFIMAETLGIPYFEVVRAAAIPAFLYFAACFWAVHLEAGRYGLVGLPKADMPDAWASTKRNWHLILPLAALVYLLFTGFTPLFAGTVGLGLTVVLILGTRIAAQLGPIVFRVVFWVIVGIVCSTFFDYGIDIVLALIAVMVVACWFAKGGRETLLILRDGLAEGSKNALGVGIACAIVGVIIGIMTLTGLGTTFVRVIVDVGKDNLFLSLLLTMVTCLILGMGIPTIPNYVITSSLVGPALLELGVPLIVSHMFVFYFGIMADLTPPVALAAFAAAPFAKESAMKIGITATRIALPGFVVPFMAVYAPSLMLQPQDPLAEAWGLPLAAAYMLFKACVAVGLWGAAAMCFLFRPLSWPERAFATLAAFLLVVSIPLTDEIGFAAGALFVGRHWWSVRRTAKPALACA